MNPRLRLLALAAGTNGSLVFCGFTLLFAAREDLGLGPAGLLVAGAFQALVYTGSCAATRGISERRGRRGPLVAGLSGIALAALACFALGPTTAALGRVAGTGALWTLYAAFAVAASLVWPALQAALGDVAATGPLRGHTGTYNLSWCGAQALAYLAAGKLLDWTVAKGLAYGIGALLAFASVALAAGVSARVPSQPSEGPMKGAPGEARSGSPRPGMLAAARVANFAMWGAGFFLGARLEHHLNGLGYGAFEKGGAYFTVGAAELGAFLFWARVRGWEYRVAPMLAFEAGGAAGLLLLVGAPSLGTAPLVSRLLVGAGGALVGLAVGTAYQASIFHALDAAGGRSRNTAFHEVFIGAGSVAIPLVGAGAAMLLGSGAGFVAVACVVLAALPVAAFLAGPFVSRVGPRVPSESRPVAA